MAIPKANYTQTPRRSYSQDAIQLLELLGDRPIGYHPAFAHAFKSVTAGILLSQLLYWHGKQRNEDGWILKTTAQLTEETAMSEREQETARRILLDFEVIEYKRMGVPAMPHYRINLQALADATIKIGQNVLTGEDVCAELDRTKRPHISESTSESTTETTAPANAGGDDDTGNESQGDTQPLEESSVDKKAAVPPPATAPPAPARAPAPPARKPDPAQVQQADDLMERYINHKQGGKLANWPITRRAIDKAVKNGAHEDKAAINAACDELKEVVSGIANAFGWRHWFDRKSALLVISLDLPLDTIRAYVQADCDGMAKKQKDREGYGMGDALQACRLGMAAHAGPPQPKELKGEYYTDQYGELKFRYLP